MGISTFPFNTGIGVHSQRALSEPVLSDSLNIWLEGCAHNAGMDISRVRCHETAQASPTGALFCSHVGLLHYNINSSRSRLKPEGRMLVHVFESGPSALYSKTMTIHTKRKSNK